MFGLNRRTRLPASERRLRERAERVLTLRRSVSVPAAPANAVMLPCRMYYDRCVDTIPPTPARAGTVWAELLVGQGAYQCN